MYTLQNFITDVNTRTANEMGASGNTIATTYANESLRRLRRKFDLPSAEVVSQMELMTGVYTYATPYSGFKDFLFLLDNYRPSDRIFMRAVTEERFWTMLQGGNLKSETRSGTTRRLLFNFVKPGTQSANLNKLDGVTTDGTWSASGDASNLLKDTLFYREGSSSLSMTITPSGGTATLTNSTFSARDLSGDAFYLTAMFTLWVYLPSSTAFTNFQLRFGSSASKYWQISSTTQIDGSALTTGWNQIGFDWKDATSSGSPTGTDAAALDYVQIVLTFGTGIGTQAGVRLNDLTARQVRIMNLHSSTDFLVIDGKSSDPKESFTSASDTSSYFNIDRSFTDFVLYETLEQIFTTHIDDADGRAFYQGKRLEAEEDLLMRFPSKRQPEVGEYMDQSRHDAWLARGGNR